MKYLNNNMGKWKIEICILNLIIFFYLLRTAIPFFKFPFIFLIITFLVYITISYKQKLLSQLLEFIRVYWLSLILAVLLITSFLFSSKIFLTIFKDVINLIILLSTFFFSSLIVHGNKELRFLLLNQANLIILFGSFIAIMGLMDLFNVNSINGYSPINEIHDLSADTIAYIDNNFAILPLIFGVIVIFYLLVGNQSRLQIFLYNLVLFLISYQILLSGSRRGLILFILIFFLVFIMKIYSIKGHNVILRSVGSKSVYFLISTLSFIILLYLFLFQASRSFQNKVLDIIGTKNVLIAKYNITKNVYRYISIINNKVTFSEVLWATSFDSYDPDSGWGSRIHKTEYPLVGNNVEIVPVGSKGYLMDSTSNAAYYPSTNVSESYTLAVNLKTFNGDRYKSSVYCYVSDSFNIDAACLTVKFSYINDKLVSGNPTAFYNLEKKNVWQKLEIDFDCREGEVPVLMSFWKKGISDFSNQNGYVMFAYPEYEKINISETGVFKKNNKKGSTLIQKFSVSNSNNVSTFEQHALYSPLNLEQLKYYSMVFIDLSNSSVINPKLFQAQQDPIRKLTSRFISEDTTYYAYKNKVLVNSKWDKIGNERILRWIFGIKIYVNEFTFGQKLFGGGFNFLNWYGYYFLKDKTASDWPHNPFLSILLYSGIFGLSIYCWFMYKVFYYYIKYIKEYPLLFIFFLITFFFNFFSGGSPFDHPIMGFFSILPFFIHSVHKREKEKELALSKFEDTAS